MHIARIETHSLDETAEAVDLGQSPAELVLLSFTDSDLAAFASAWERMGEPRPSLRLANLAALKHPYSVDLYVEKVCAGARFILVRMLGGVDYWRYGVEQLAALAKARGIALALVPGDRFDDPRLAEASTLDAASLRRLWRYFDEGGPDNMAACLGLIVEGEAPAPRAVAAFGVYGAPHPRPLPVKNGEGRPAPPGILLPASCGEGLGVGPPSLLPLFAGEGGAKRRMREDPHPGPLPRRAGEGALRALIVFYRSIYLADDLAPIDALARALEARGLEPTCVYVTSLKDEADAPVLQVALASAGAEAWAASTRGLSPSDLAMHVALPEIDGRIFSRAISFKRARPRNEILQFSRVDHAPMDDRVAFVADLALAWTRLRRTPRCERRLACVLSDYPSKGGRVGYAVGLDTPASVVAIGDALREAGYDIPAAIEAEALIAHLSQGPEQAVLSLADYADRFAALPEAFRQSVVAAWGHPAVDPAVREDAFAFRIVRVGKSIMAVQPDRGRRDARKGEYHDLALAPRHAYVAFYIWLREVERIDALIHLGAHGTLEWLPGKAVALSRDCAAEATLGPVPVIYPFIVNNPGEAAQAKRRIGAVTIGHLTPPLVEAGAHGAAHELEALFDEFSQAQSFDPRRARVIADLILARASEAGLLRECDADGTEPDAALRKLDAWLCELKDMRIGDGLHVFGTSPPLPLFAGEGRGEGDGGEATPHPALRAPFSRKGRREEAGVSPLSPCGRGVGGEGSGHYDGGDLSSGASRHLLPQGEKGSAPLSPWGVGGEGSARERLCAFSREEREKGCGPAELRGLLAALDGRFVPPGPAGAPSRGRLDVLPTGRNLFAIDPRSVPTRNAWEIGRRAAEDVVARYAQDHGDWPRRIVLDLWGSASMRTGGEEIAQAFAFIGARPKWDHASNRVNAFEILPLASLGRPRVDVTIRISGLFRDVFPTQIALLDAAFRAVAARDESAEDNPLSGETASRIFGAAPGRYGVGLGGILASGDWRERDELGRAYLDATSHAYDDAGEGRAAGAAFGDRIARADAFVHAQDMAGQDVLDSDAFAEHEGGFAAAAAMRGATPAIYHVDSTRPERVAVRPLRQEIARVLRARAINPRWIAGQMRHGHRGASEIAETLDNLFAYAALTDAVESRQFDLYFDATLGDEAVRGFLVAANPLAAKGMAAKFAEASRRGFWLSRRNSSAAILAALTGEAA